MCHGAYPQKKSLQLKLIDINCNYQLILFCDRSPINCPIRKLVVIFVHHRPMQLSAFFPLEEELFLIRGEGPIITINNYQLILIVNFFQLILPALAQPIQRSERQNQLKFNFLGVFMPWRHGRTLGGGESVLAG